MIRRGTLLSPIGKLFEDGGKGGFSVAELGKTYVAIRYEGSRRSILSLNKEGDMLRSSGDVSSGASLRLSDLVNVSFF